MKTEHHDHEELRSVLKDWAVEEPLPARFEEGVWRRIEVLEAQKVQSGFGWRSLRGWISNLLPRPAMATAYVCALLVAGAGLGWARAQHEAAQVDTRLRDQYVKVVDPFIGIR